MSDPLIVQVIRNHKHRVVVARIVRTSEMRRHVPDGTNPYRLHVPIEIEEADIRPDATFLDEGGNHMSLEAWHERARRLLSGEAA